MLEQPISLTGLMLEHETMAWKLRRYLEYHFTIKDYLKKDSILKDKTMKKNHTIMYVLGRLHFSSLKRRDR
jgi:hypothetical protein